MTHASEHSSGRLKLNLAGLHVALIEPEIPPNTGNIARLCAATFTPLHLVGKLGFRTDDKAVRRAGLDYWSEVEIHYHLNAEALY
jgi:tRNA (cytidine/uridine-2'-O-)-methyltransferase